jgi:hypothetical protein
VVVYPAPHLDAMPMAALVLQVDDECFGTTVMFPESLRSAECPGSARLLALISEREAANAAEAAAVAAVSAQAFDSNNNGAVHGSHGNNNGAVSPSSSSSSCGSPSSPPPPPDMNLASNNTVRGRSSSSSSSDTGNTSPLHDANGSIDLSSLPKTEYTFSEQAADSQDYCLVPIKEIPIPPMARANRYRCSINKAMERLLGFGAEDMRRRASVRGWQLLWRFVSSSYLYITLYKHVLTNDICDSMNRMVSPRETQQFLMNHWRSIAGLVSEWSMSLHLATKVFLSFTTLT